MSNNNLFSVENSEELKTMLADNPYVLVDFYADWCGPCKALTPVIEKVAKQNEDVKFIKINVDKAKDLAEKHNISSIPTLIYFREGQEINKTFGFIPESGLANHLKNLKVIK